MKKGLSMVVLLLIISFLGWGNTTYAVFTIPDGKYSFLAEGVLYDAKQVEKSTLFTEILKAKQSSITDEFNTSQKEDFTNRKISGDLDYVNGGGLSFWSIDPSTLSSSSTETIFKMRQGGVEYQIYVPPGIRYVDVETIEFINQNEIGYTINAINEYKRAVRESVLAASMTVAYNVYSVIPNKQVPLTDILSKAEGTTGGGMALKATGGVTLSYSLDYFFHPLFGKFDANGLDNSSKEANQKFWEAKIDEVVLDTANDSASVEFQLDPSYLTFYEQLKAGESTLSPVDSAAVVNANGVKSYKTIRSQKEYNPASLVDGAMYLMVPTYFYKNLDNNYFKIPNDGGFSVVPDVKLLVTHNYVYGKDIDIYTRLGDFASYGIDPLSLVLFKTKIDTDGNYSESGKEVGAVIPLWYQEAMMDTKNTTEMYITGRVIKFGNDYSGKITLDITNKDLFAVDAKTTGKQGIEPRRFAFTKEADVSVATDHQALPNNPDSFRMFASFAIPSSPESNEPKGFFIYRNNFYINDDSLLSWLESKEAQALTDVEADKLHALITGKFELESTTLTYAQWKRLQDIKGEFENGYKNFLLLAAATLIRVIGILLLFYAVLLFMLYWVDTSGLASDFSTIHFLTGGRYYPVASMDDLGYYTSSANTTYINLPQLALLCGIIAGLGVFCIFGVSFFFSWGTYLYLKFLGG